MKSKTIRKAQSASKKIQKNSKKELEKLQRLAKEKLSSFSKTASKDMGYAKDELKELEERAKDYIKKNPEKLFLAAAGIGAFVGALTATLIKRKGKKRK